MLKQAWYRLVRFGFRLLYYELAWTYDLVSWLVSLGEWRNWQRAALPFISGRRVLEMGHGPGHMLLTLEETGYEVVGLDLSPYMGRLAQRRLRRSGAADLVRARGQALPFAANIFDTVLATFPTDYIVEAETLAAVRRVLRADGRLVIVPEAHLVGTGLHHRFIDWLYTVTGQRQVAFAVDESKEWPQAQVWQPYQERFARVGFQVQLERVQLGRSRVTVLILAVTDG